MMLVCVTHARAYAEHLRGEAERDLEREAILADPALLAAVRARRGERA